MSRFLNGMAISDMASGIEKTAMSSAHRAEMELATDEFLDSKREVAELVAERTALRAALEQLDPNHPLLTDQTLRERMRKAGRENFNEQMGAAGKISWEAVARASDAVKYDYTPPTFDEQMKGRHIGLDVLNVPKMEGESLASGRVEEAPIQGTCPNCETTLSLAANECPKCRAMFGVGSAWVIQPLAKK